MEVKTCHTNPLGRNALPTLRPSAATLLLAVSDPQGGVLTLTDPRVATKKGNMTQEVCCGVGPIPGYYVVTEFENIIIIIIEKYGRRHRLLSPQSTSLTTLINFLILRRRKTLIPNRDRWSSLSLFRQINLGEGKL